jgi:hypothetical protein
MDPMHAAAAAELDSSMHACGVLLTLSRMSRAMRPTTASWLLPAPPPPLLLRGCRPSSVPSSSYVSACWHVMSAFSCSPKISGLGTSG